MANVERHEGTQTGARRTAPQGPHHAHRHLRTGRALLMPDEQSTDTKAARASYDASVRFVGLVHALQASAETALGDDTSPLRNARRQGLEGVKAARRSLGLLEMLQE